MPTDRPSPSRASAPRLEEAEEGVIRSMEASGRSVQPSVYDALSSTRDGNEGKPKPKPSFARLVRKVMVEQQQVRKEGSPSPGHHRRGSSNAQIYNLLQKMRDNESEPVLGDAFQNHFFFKEEESSLSDIAERSEDPLEGEDPVQAFGFTDGNGDRPMDSTPLLARRRGRKETKSFCDAASVQRFFWDIFLHCWLLVVAAAMAGVAIVLFYKFENPEIDALPGNATVAWWCNFGARLIVILEVSRVLKFLVIDCLVLGGGLSVKYMGAFITLLSLQAKDWPFVLSAWGILNAIFLHGDNKFNNHWLYGTGWEIYSMASNSGLRIIASDTYLRLLLCMIVVGVATALKRTFLAISFGRRQYSIFKPRLEKLLLDVVLLNEVASLSAELDGVEMQGSTSTKPAGKAKRGAMGDVSWDSVKMKQEEEEDSETEQAEEEKGTYSRSSSEGSFLKQLLDRWEEPTSQQDRMDATIEDVLRFRRALTFMDEFYPFGVDFGPASTRDESISSAEAVYSKLCKLGKESGRLPFSTLALIAMEEDETYDDVKKRALRRLFHPDADKTLTLLAFVQSCDTIYRRLRYFLATVNNSASLDKVLENAIDGIYYFVLGLFLMSLMNYNAWSLLVSLTSLLVSFSFAFGQTVSKYVQGIILIAVTRPFDLGDRIFLTPAGEVAKELENAGNTWFVEDITLSSTKMRYARTGEVAYLSNHLMSDMRIYNCNRSPNAIVVIQHILKIAILDSDYYDRFKKAMRQFVSDRPRMWVELLVMRADKIDSDMEQVFLTMQFRHRNSWQDAPRIFLQRSELLRFIHETSKKMNLSFETPPPRRVLYYGGQLEQGAVEDSHRTDLLTSANVRNNSERSGMGMPPLDKM